MGNRSRTTDMFSTGKDLQKSTADVSLDAHIIGKRYLYFGIFKCRSDRFLQSYGRSLNGWRSKSALRVGERLRSESERICADQISNSQIAVQNLSCLSIVRLHGVNLVN